MLAKLKPTIKKAIKDEHMFKWVQNLTDEIVEDIWPDIERLVLMEFRTEFEKPVVL